MTRAELKTFISDGVNTVNPSLDFGAGRVTEWNSNRSNEYPGVWLESPNSDTDIPVQMPFDDWSVILHIGKKDHAGSSPEQYELIIDECDLIAQKLIKQYNDVLNGYATITITGISRVPFIHKHADDVTGVILSFTLRAPATVNLC